MINKKTKKCNKRSNMVAKYFMICKYTKNIVRNKNIIIGKKIFFTFYTFYTNKLNVCVPLN